MGQMSVTTLSQQNLAQATLNLRIGTADDTETFLILNAIRKKARM